MIFSSAAARSTPEQGESVPAAQPLTAYARVEDRNASTTFRFQIHFTNWLNRLELVAVGRTTRAFLLS